MVGLQRHAQNETKTLQGSGAYLERSDSKFLEHPRVQQVSPSACFAKTLSYLRKSYISTALQTIKTSHERTQLAFKLEHSPSASLKYIRELQDIDQLDEEAVELARSGKLTSRKLD